MDEINCLKVDTYLATLMRLSGYTGQVSVQSIGTSCILVNLFEFQPGSSSSIPVGHDRSCMYVLSL